MYKDVYIYLAANIVNAVLSFGTVSFLTHELTTLDYGIINLYSSFLIFLMPFVSAGILTPITIEFFKRPERDYAVYFSNAQVIPLLSAFAIFILCYVFAGTLQSLLKVSSAWIYVMPFVVWLGVVNESAMIVTRNRNRPFQFAFFSIGKNAVEISLTLTFVLGLHWAWQGRLLSATLAPCLFGLIAIYLFYKWRYSLKNLDFTLIKKILILSLPFVFERLSVFVMGNIDKYFIDHYDRNGTNEVGLYALGSQIAAILYLVVISMNSAYQPYLFKRLSEGHRGSIHRVTFLYIAVCAASVICLYIATPIIFNFFIGDEFQGGKIYAYVLCGSYFMWGIYNALQSYLLFLARKRLILFIAMIGLCLSISSNWVLVPMYGAIGAAFSSVITYTSMATAAFISVKKII